MTTPASALTLQFLAWVAARPRSYQETMEAWRTSCPRLSIWEDAVREGFVAVERRNGQSMKLSAVVLTGRGAALLRAGEAPAAAAPKATGQMPAPVG